LDPAAGGAAVLRSIQTLTITDPVRQPPRDETARRAFPFDQVEIVRRAFADLAPAAWRYTPDGLPAYFWPSGAPDPLLFPAACPTPLGVVRLVLQLIFVANPGTDPARLAAEYGQRVAPIPGTVIDLVRASQPRDGDAHEVYSLTIAGGPLADGYRPRLAGLEIALPA